MMRLIVMSGECGGGSVDFRLLIVMKQRIFAERRVKRPGNEKPRGKSSEEKNGVESPNKGLESASLRDGKAYTLQEVVFVIDLREMAQKTDDFHFLTQVWLFLSTYK
jgi:hypothetical protein